VVNLRADSLFLHMKIYSEVNKTISVVLSNRVRCGFVLAR
jgi:hypothetical protein